MSSGVALKTSVTRTAAPARTRLIARRSRGGAPDREGSLIVLAASAAPRATERERSEPRTGLDGGPYLCAVPVAGPFARLASPPARAHGHRWKDRGSESSRAASPTSSYAARAPALAEERGCRLSFSCAAILLLLRGGALRRRAR